MSVNKPFEVDASVHGFGKSGHGAVNKRSPKTGDAGGGLTAEQLQVRANDPSSQLGVKQFSGAMQWLKDKYENTEEGQKFKADLARQKASSPWSGNLGTGLRAIRTLKNRLAGDVYARQGLAQGYSPKYKGPGDTKSELMRLLRGAKPRKWKARHSAEDNRNIKSTFDQMHADMKEAVKEPEDEMYNIESPYDKKE